MNKYQLDAAIQVFISLIVLQDDKWNKHLNCCIKLVFIQRYTVFFDAVLTRLI